MLLRETLKRTVIPRNCTDLCDSPLGLSKKNEMLEELYLAAISVLKKYS